MTDDDAGLSHTEAAQWDAIVSSEWPVESAILTTQLSSTSSPSGASAESLSSASSRSTSHRDHDSHHWLSVSWHSRQVRG